LWIICVVEPEVPVDHRARQLHSFSRHVTRAVGWRTGFSAKHGQMQTSSTVVTTGSKPVAVRITSPLFRQRKNSASDSTDSLIQDSGAKIAWTIA